MTPGFNVFQIYLGQEHVVSQVIFTHSSDRPNPAIRYHIQVTVSPYPEHPVLPLIGHNICYMDPINQTMPVRVIGECTNPIRGKFVALRKYAPNPNEPQSYDWVLTQVQVSLKWKPVYFLIYWIVANYASELPAKLLRKCLFYNQNFFSFWDSRNVGGFTYWILKIKKII